jgi:hypothetical protein
MGSEQIQVVDPPSSLIIKLWLLALAGLVIPTAIAYYWPEMGWVGKAERAHNRSIQEEQWQDPWEAIDQKVFSSGWLRCSSLEDALALDRSLDDGNLYTGKLVLSKGGLAWLPE